LKVELKNSAGDYEELTFDIARVEQGELELFMPYTQEIELPAFQTMTFYLDLSTARITDANKAVYENALLTECIGGSVKVSLDYPVEENTIYAGSFEYDNNGNIIYTNSNEDYAIFLNEPDNKNIHDIDGDIVELFTGVYDNNGNKLRNVQVSLTHEPAIISPYRNYDNIPTLWFEHTYTPLTGTVTVDGNEVTGTGTLFTSEASPKSLIRFDNEIYFILSIESDTKLFIDGTHDFQSNMNAEAETSRILKSEDFTCEAVTVGTDLCYCETLTTLTHYSCSSGDYYSYEGIEGSCTYTRANYDIVCNGAVALNSNDCSSVPEGCDCVENPIMEACTCSSQIFSDFLICNSELSQKRVIESYYTKNIINDADFSNNMAEADIGVCAV